MKDNVYNKALQDAYQAAGLNTYFDHGFKAGVEAAEKDANGNKWMKDTLERSLRANKYLLGRNKALKEELACSKKLVCNCKSSDSGMQREDVDAVILEVFMRMEDRGLEGLYAELMEELDNFFE